MHSEGLYKTIYWKSESFNSIRERERPYIILLFKYIVAESAVLTGGGGQEIEGLHERQ